MTAPPLLKRIVIKIIPDTNQIIAQLKTGDLDAATSDAFPAPTEVLDKGAEQAAVQRTDGVGGIDDDLCCRYGITL